MSLMELTVTLAMLATIATATMSLVRTSHTSWIRHDDDQAQRRQALALHKHIVRHIRQATSVMNISSSSDNSGTLSLLMPSGDTYVWNHNSSTKQVLFGSGYASSLLATGIEELTFVAYNADGTTEVSEVGLIHAIRPIVKYNLVRPAGSQTYTHMGQAWLRSW